MPTHVMALDQGTTSSRAIIFDTAGRPVACAQQPLASTFPQPGWVEQDPSEILRTQVESARQALAQARLRARDLAAIGITNQRETTLVWDRHTGEPVHNAIVWQCRRTADRCEALRAAGWSEPVLAGTGLVIDPYFSATKVAWVLDHVPGARERAERGDLLFGTVDTWLLWNLSNHRLHATDASNASRTMLYNIHTRDWDAGLLGALGVPHAMLPEIRPSSEVYGHTGFLGPEVPLAACIGDQQSALFGQACFAAGTAKNTYGTGCFLLMNTGPTPVTSRHGLLTTVAWQLGQAVTYALEGSVFVAGAAVQWLRDELGLLQHATESEALARSVPDTGGVYFVPAFVGLGAPHWRADVRGALVGLTRGTGRAHVARAALEAIAYQTADVLDAMADDLAASLPELRVDGGAAVNDFLLQFQADILGVPVIRPAVVETTALGAAYLAGLATGVWGGQDELAARWSAERTFRPELDAARRAQLRCGWQQAVRSVLG